MLKKSGVLLFVTGMSLLSACATVVPRQDVPIDPSNGLPTLESIVARVTCELTTALYATPRNQDYFLSNDINVALQLSLDVNDTGSLAPTFAYLAPPTFMFNTGATLAQSREQNYFQKLYYSMRQLDEEAKIRRKLRHEDLAATCPNVDTNLAGDLGLRQAIDLALTASNRLQEDAKLQSSTDGSFGGFVQFIVTKNLNMVGPTWTLTHFKGPGNFAGVSEVNTDKITFAFARGKNAGKPLTYLASSTERADNLLAQININQLSTQLGGIRQALQ